MHKLARWKISLYPAYYTVGIEALDLTDGLKDTLLVDCVAGSTFACKHLSGQQLSGFSEEGHVRNNTIMV